MKHVFYLLTIAPILWEAINLMGIKKTHNFLNNLKQIKGKEFSEWTENQKSFTICMIGYILWNFAGFFTFQWVLFVCLFLLGLLPKKYIWYRWLDSLISISILIFIIINAYHFKIDIWALILSLV